MTVIYEKRNYRVEVDLFDCGTGGVVTVKRKPNPRIDTWATVYDRWDNDASWEFNHPVKHFWHCSLQKASMLAIDFLNRQVAKELENEANLEVIKEIVSELPEMLS